MEELLYGAGMLCIYYVIAASTMLLGRVFLKIPDELFRKMLHFVLLGSYTLFITTFDNWWMSVIFAVLFEAVVYPILKWFERFEKFSGIVNERKKGELKKSLLLAFTMLAVCIVVCWGLMGEKLLVLACMYAWGVGDAFAALIGKTFGKHKIKWKRVDGKKSVEGSTAMFLTSALAVLAVLLFRGGLSIAGYIVIPIAGAGICTFVELLTTNGNDTVTCPTAAMVVMLPLVVIFGGGL